ncbi:MAG: AEC family transporter [Candidatus Symbiothrix sp.]|jgi:predicted permease|nr:AEC family transporter [Candidatus Symbiothrix sp.]
MINFILIFLCISAGFVMSRTKMLPADAHKSVNAWILYIALPALSLRFVPAIEWSSDILFPILVPFVVWGGAWLFVHLYDHKKRLSAGSHTALFITCGLGNTAFIGFPMIAAFYGESEIHHAVVIDQLTFILFATLGVITILRTASEQSHKVSVASVLKKVFRFPPFDACILALILPHFFDISIINPLLDKLVATMSPMALFSIGLQLKLGAFKQEWRLVSAGLFYKLLLAPFLVLLVALVLHSKGKMASIGVFEAGMSSHITASLLASQYNLNPRYCSLVVGMGILLSFITSAGWYFATGLLLVE